MLANKITNTEILGFLQSFISNPEIKAKFGNHLIKKLSFIPLSVVSKYKKYPNYQDLLQIGFLALWEAFCSFDFNKGNNFLYWAYVLVKQAVSKEALREKKYLNTHKPHVIQDSADEFNFIENKVLEVELTVILSDALISLNQTQRLIIAGLYDNKTLREIGCELNMSHESIRRIRDVTLKQLRVFIDKN